MELCQCDLFSIQKSYNPLDILRTKKFMIDALNGLKYIHSQNIVHRDIKLKNLLLSQNNVIKIADFGLAVQLKNVNKYENITCGTLSYMAPEAIKPNQNITKSIDIWSIGICMYSLITGNLPFRGEKFEYFLLAKIGIYDKPYWLKAKCGGLAALKIIDKLLQFDADARPTAAELLQTKFFTTNDYDSCDTVNSFYFLFFVRYHV